MTTRQSGSPLSALAPSALLARTLAPHRDALLEALARVVEGGTFVMGAQGESFEAEIAAALKVEHAVGVSSGTDALALALAACGVGRGDRVITPSLTASAGGAAIRQIGAVAVYADVEPDRLTIDPVAVSHALTRHATRPAAIVAVHLHGQPADLAALRAVSNDAGIPLVEDCAQALGATVGDVSCGAWGDAAALSFYPTKNLGALGDAGAVLTGDPAIATRVRRMREYGWIERQRSAGWGINARLDEMQAACLRVLLPHLSTWNARRRAIARILDDALGSQKLLVPAARPPDALSVYHRYIIRSNRRDDLAHALRKRGVPAGPHPPYGLHEQSAFASDSGASLTETERALREILGLPISPAMTDEDARLVATIVRDAVLEIG